MQKFGVVGVLAPDAADAVRMSRAHIHPFTMLCITDLFASLEDLLALACMIDRNLSTVESFDLPYAG